MIENPLILHIPHSSTMIPDMNGYKLDFIELFKEMDILTDRYTDELFRSDKDITVRTDFSRIFCDVERFEDDKREVMAKYGMGAVYSHTDDGRLMRIVDRELRGRIIAEYYKPHHQDLFEAVDRQMKTYGEARIVDCHSFPDKPFHCDLNRDNERPDICIGRNSWHTPYSWVVAAMEFFRFKGLSVCIDIPYASTIIPQQYLYKNTRVKSIMIEVNRKLYMDEKTLERNKGFKSTQIMIHDFLYMIRELPSDYKLDYKWPEESMENYAARKKVKHINYLTNYLKYHEKFKHVRLKCWGGYPRFSVQVLQDESLDWVDQKTFEKIEEDRIPLFVGCMGGVGPRFTPGFFNGEKIIVTMGYSVLNGSFGGLTFRKLPEGVKLEDLYWFSGKWSFLNLPVRSESSFFQQPDRA